MRIKMARELFYLVKKYGFKTIIIFSLFSGDALSHDGTVNITGNILSSSCSVSVGDQTKPISLGEYSSSSLVTVGQKTEFVPLNISLENCSAGISGTKILVSGTSDTDNINLLQISNPSSDSSASGIAVLVVDSKGDNININNQSDLQPLSVGSNSINLQLAYEVTKLPVRAGDANSIMYLDFSYQ